MNEKETARNANISSATGNSPGNAIPVGAAVKIPIIPGYGPGTRIGDLVLSVLEVKRGEHAEPDIQPEGSEFKPLKSGFENIFMRVKVEYIRAGRGPRQRPYYLSPDQFRACSFDGGEEYEILYFSERSGENLIGHTFDMGDSREGWLMCQLPEKELKPFLLYRRENVDNVWGLWSDIWFKLF